MTTKTKVLVIARLTMKDCPNGCDQKDQKPNDDFCARCEELLETRWANHYTETSTMTTKQTTKAEITAIKKRMRSRSGYSSLIDGVNTFDVSQMGEDIDTLLAALEEREREVAKFATLADERHDLLSAERRMRDEARKLYSEALTKLVTNAAQIKDLHSRLTEAHEQIKQLTWERDSAKESEWAMLEAAMKQSRQFLAADRELTEARAEIEGLRLAAQVKMAGEEFLQSTLGQIISTARNDVLDEAIAKVKLVAIEWANANVAVVSEKISDELESLKRGVNENK